MMDYDERNAESLMHKHGAVAVIVHKDQLSRDEKDVVRAAAMNDPDSNIMQVGDSFVLVIAEEPEDYDEEALALYEEYQDDESKEPVKTLERGDRYLGGEPTMHDLRSLKVSELQALADKEGVDLTGLKLKDDILGRVAAHFGVGPQED